MYWVDNGWFRAKYSWVKSSRDFWILRWSALFLMNILRFGRCLCLGEMITSMMTVLWSAMPSTTFSFFINTGLFVKTRSMILLAFPCLHMGSFTCWINPCTSTRVSHSIYFFYRVIKQEHVINLSLFLPKFVFDIATQELKLLVCLELNRAYVVCKPFCACFDEWRHTVR